jgi:hypothetical protein
MLYYVYYCLLVLHGTSAAKPNLRTKDWKRATAINLQAPGALVRFTWGGKLQG